MNIPYYFHAYYSGWRYTPFVDCGHVCTQCVRCNANESDQRMCYHDCMQCKRCITTPGRGTIPGRSECEMTCGSKSCFDYTRQRSMYERCLEQYHNTRDHCLQRFGCKVWRGPMFRRVPPINPKYTSCQKCWESGFTVI